MRAEFKRLLLLFALTSSPWLPVCELCADENSPPAAAADSGSPEPMLDQPIADFQRELLQIASEAASSYPIDPHIKNRARAQEQVVAACLKLGQPVRALEYTKQIQNWRRGTCYADLALYLARQGRDRQAEVFLKLAAQIASAQGLDESRSNQIKEKMLEAYAHMGLDQQADQVQGGVFDLKADKAAAMKAMRGGESLEQTLSALDVLLESSNYDHITYALRACTTLFDRYYDAPEQRAAVEAKIDGYLAKVPIFVQIDVLMQLTEIAIEKGDPDTAMKRVNDAQAVFDGAQWVLDRRIGLMAELAGLRFRAGDEDKARHDVEAAWTLFQTEIANIRDYQRAGAIRPIAEAHQAMGDTARSLEIYRLTVEQGSINPNLRPRIDNLTATCVSMALNAVEPDTELWARIRQIRDGLEQP